MSYVIEEGIPLPVTNRGGNFVGPQSEWTKTLNSLEVGQSVLTPEYKEFKAADAFAFRQKVKRFAIRKVAGQGWRVWRAE